MDKSIPAFPVAEDHKTADSLEWTSGMTLRDYFAAKVMTALIIHNGLTRDTVKDSFNVADDMLKAREE